MSLISLKCPNCSGSIELDGKKEFGFCMHCGHKVILTDNSVKTVRFDNSHSLKNWVKLAEVARKANNLDDLSEYVKKILEVDTNNAKAWILKGSASAIECNFNEAAVHWRVGVTMASSSKEFEEFCDLIVNDMTNGLIQHFNDSFGQIKVTTLLADVFNEYDGKGDYDFFELFADPVSFGLNKYIIRNIKTIDSSVFYKIFVSICSIRMASLRSSLSCFYLLESARTYRDIVKRCQELTKIVNYTMPEKDGAGYYDERTIKVDVSEELSVLEMLVPLYEKYFSNISKEKNERIRDHWDKHSDEHGNLLELLDDGIFQNRVFFREPNAYEWKKSLFGYKTITTKREDGKATVEAFLKAFTQVE